MKHWVTERKSLSQVINKYSFTMIGIVIGLRGSFMLMYGRKRLSLSLRWVVSILGISIGLYGLTGDGFGKDQLIIFWGYMSLGSYFIFDRLLYVLNVRVQNRDFILWLKGSNEINSYGRNSHVNWLDKLSSVMSLLFIVALMGLGAHLFRNG